jgi:type IV secretion system protein VirD4
MTSRHIAIYLVFCGSIAMAVWILSYGLILQFVYQDARILHMTVTTNPLAPVQQLLAYPASRSLQVAALGALMPAAMAATGAAVFGLRSPSNPLGDAAFQDLPSLRRGKWFRKDGHVFGRIGGRLLRRNDDRHHLIIGPTRSGKGVGYVIPNALTFPGSMIVTDLKGEIFEKTAAYRRANGHRVFLFSPGAEKTHRWNPLDFVRTDRGNRTIDIQNIASILIPETIGSDSAVWQGTGQQVIAGVISYVLESRHYGNRRNLAEVDNIFSSGTDLQVLMKRICEKEPDLSKFTTDSFNAYIALNERAARSALLDIHKALVPLRNERVIAATQITDIDLRSMRRRPVSIYLAPNITDVTILRPLLTLFIQQVMDLLTRELTPKALPAYFLLDEFRQLKKMDEVMNKLPYVAGYNIKMAFIIQDLKNLDEIYGETARHSLLGNCGLQLIFGANDQATAEYASRALGKKTIRYKSESRTLALMGLPRRTKIEQIRERDLLMPQEVRQMPSDRMLLLVEGQRPIFATKLKHHEIEPYKSAAGFSEHDPPAAPVVDFVMGFPVPATTEAYSNETMQDTMSEPVKELSTSPATQPQDVATFIITDLPDVQSPAETPRDGVVKDVHHLRARQVEVETQLVSTAVRLRRAIADKTSDQTISVARRCSIAEILQQTIPDPLDLGLEH